MVELVGMCIIAPFGISRCSARDPWVPFVNVFIVAVLIGMTGVEPMLRAVTLHLKPSSALGVLLHILLFPRLVLVLMAGLSGISGCEGVGAHVHSSDYCL